MRIVRSRTIPAVVLVLAATACGSSDDAASPSNSTTTSTVAAVVDTVAVETSVVIGVADVYVVPYTGGDGVAQTLFSVRVAVTNNTTDSLEADFQLGISCPGEASFEASYPDFPTLEAMDISAGEQRAVDAGATEKVFALPVLIADSATPCADGAEHVVIMRLGYLLCDQPTLTVNLPVVGDPSTDSEAFVVLGSVSELKASA